MTKRWERELRRLDDVDAPTERIRAHAADRPADPSRGDGLRPADSASPRAWWPSWCSLPRDVRLASLPPARGAVDGRCSRHRRGARRDLDSPAETQGDIAFPTATFTLGGHSIDIPTQGIDGWPDIPDDVGFDQPLYSLGFDVPAGTQLVVQGDVSSASATIRDDVAIDTAAFVDLDLSDGAGTLPADVGQHVIDLTGTWPDGTATFTAAFRIVPAASARDPSAVPSSSGRTPQRARCVRRRMINRGAQSRVRLV